MLAKQHVMFWRSQTAKCYTSILLLWWGRYIHTKCIVRSKNNLYLDSNLLYTPSVWAFMLIDATSTLRGKCCKHILSYLWYVCAVPSQVPQFLCSLACCRKVWLVSEKNICHYPTNLESLCHYNYYSSQRFWNNCVISCTSWRASLKGLSTLDFERLSWLQCKTWLNAHGL